MYQILAREGIKKLSQKGVKSSIAKQGGSRAVNKQFVAEMTAEEVKEQTADSFTDGLKKALDNSDGGVQVEGVDDILEDVKEEVEEMPKGVSKKFNKTVELPKFIKKLSTPGGIGLLLAIILFIVFAIKPVGDTGTTRLGLAFRTLLGHTKLEGGTDGEEEGLAYEEVIETGKDVGNYIGDTLFFLPKAGAELGIDVGQGVSQWLQGIGQ